MVMEMSLRVTSPKPVDERSKYKSRWECDRLEEVTNRSSGIEKAGKRHGRIARPTQWALCLILGQSKETDVR